MPALALVMAAIEDENIILRMNCMDEFQTETMFIQNGIDVLNSKRNPVWKSMAIEENSVNLGYKGPGYTN